MKIKSLLLAATCALLALSSCHHRYEVEAPEGEYVPDATGGNGMLGFYILNQGNIGSNKCTLDYFDYASKSYYRNIYAIKNPNAILELGDTGNDMKIFGTLLFITLNGSHKVEMLDAYTAERVGQIDVSSPRYLACDGQYVYVSSYVGGEDGRGTVRRIDPGTLSVTGTCEVGYQPEEMVITDGKLYVANSVNLTTNEYDNTISVIKLDSFTKVAEIEVAINMNHMKIDEFDNIWVTSRGNYYDVPASLVMLSKQDGEYAVAKTYDMPASNIAMRKTWLYSYQVTYDANWNATNTFTVGTINSKGFTDTPTNFLNGSIASEIESPYCIDVQPNDGTVFITDAKNYVSSGKLYCFSSKGDLQWQINTGDIPCCLAFLPALYTNPW